MVLGAEALETVENRKTSLDLIGQIGALFNVVFAALGAIFLKYNEGKFYEKNPAWSRITPEFTVEEGADESIAQETTKLMEMKTDRTLMNYASGEVT
jgi:uncharacterized protein (UPF0261 family)